MKAYLGALRAGALRAGAYSSNSLAYSAKAVI